MKVSKEDLKWEVQSKETRYSLHFLAMFPNSVLVVVLLFAN